MEVSAQRLLLREAVPAALVTFLPLLMLIRTFL